MSRWYSKRGTGVKTKMPIKDDKQLDQLMTYLLMKRDNETEEIKRYERDRDWFFVILGINFAFRTQDLLELKVSNLERGYVCIRENKTGKVQNFRMNKYLYQDFKDYVDRNHLTRNEYLFTSQKGYRKKPVSRQQMNNRLREAADELKLPVNLSCYTLRKTFAYKYIKEGGDINTLSRMLNHDSVEVTQRYICWGSDDAENDRFNVYNGGVHRRK